MCERGAVLAYCAIALSACDGTGLRHIEEMRVWSCSESSQSCTCFVEQQGVTRGLGGAPVDRCGSFNCCLQSKTDDEEDCDCFDSATTCEAEAASRRNAEVVTQCPPPGEEPPPGECAGIGENCTRAYLATNELDGCCAGTVCRATAEGLRVCGAASAEEIELARQCDIDGRQIGGVVLEVTQPSVMTNIGTFELSAATFALLRLGPNGCPSQWDLTLRSAQDTFCELSLKVQVVGGRYEVTNAFASFERCPGYLGPSLGTTFNATKAEEIPFEFAFHGLSCDRVGGVPGTCVSGSFDFHLQGSIKNVMFADQHLTLAGTICGSLTSGSECAAP